MELLTTYRDVLEVGALFSIKKQDIKSFETYLCLIKPFYFDFKLPASQNMHYLMAMELLRLLTLGKLSEFHCYLELIEDKSNKFILYSIQIEQYLMEGNYSKIFKLASVEFSLFLRILLGSVQGEIKKAICASFNDKNGADDLLFGAQLTEEDVLTQDQPEMLHDDSITQILSYAKELERIV